MTQQLLNISSFENFTLQMFKSGIICKKLRLSPQEVEKCANDLKNAYVKVMGRWEDNYFTSFYNGYESATDDLFSSKVENLVNFDFNKSTSYIKKIKLNTFEDLSKIPSFFIAKKIGNSFVPLQKVKDGLNSLLVLRSLYPELIREYAAIEATSQYSIGLNLYSLPLVVVDCDEDKLTQLEMFKNMTLCYQNPTNPYKFHLYFYCSYPYKKCIRFSQKFKIDVLGNDKNNLVFFKNKTSNHLPILNIRYIKTFLEALKAY